MDPNTRPLRRAVLAAPPPVRPSDRAAVRSDPAAAVLSVPSAQATLDIMGNYLCVSTSKQIIKIWDIARREPRQHNAGKVRDPHNMDYPSTRWPESPRIVVHNVLPEHQMALITSFFVRPSGLRGHDERQADRDDLDRPGGPSRRRDCHMIAPPCTFGRCFNRDINRGVSSK